MSEKPKPYNERIVRLLEIAFAAAKRGDVDKARACWQAAIKRGYVVKPKTERNLFRIIDIWEAERRAANPQQAVPDDMVE